MSDYKKINPNEGRNRFPSLWNQIQLAWSNGRIPQAMLFVGTIDCALIDFINYLTQFITCKKKECEPCGACNDCQMAIFGEHPDVDWIKPEKNNGSIKIDQIRELQTYSYLTPQRSTHRLIVIEPADHMNGAAANALLKVLEEPAQHTLFLLVAKQLSTVLPTVLSRCQIMCFPSDEDLFSKNLLQLVNKYPHDSEEVMILNQIEFILNGLIAVIEKKEHPCVVAEQWSQFDLATLLWFLYRVYAQIQIIQINTSITTDPATHQLNHLASVLNPFTIFAQIDKINVLQRKLSHNMTVNQTLVLEDLLLAFSGP